LPAEHPDIPGAKIELQFPRAEGLRIVVRLLVILPPGVALKPISEGEAPPKVRVNVEGVIEQDGRYFDGFAVRFEPKPPEPQAPMVLAGERALRPGGNFVVRLRVRDEVGGAETVLAQSFTVPSAPQAGGDAAGASDNVIEQITNDLATKQLPGRTASSWCRRRTTSWSASGAPRR
jgi:hypothetical protein